jgi:hypothetical protein
MREFEFVIDNALKNGLSPDKGLPPNSEYLSECLGFRCGRSGLEPHIVLTNPLPPAFDMLYSWPFPQLVVGEKNKFLIVRDLVTDLGDNVYLVSEDNQTLTWLFLFDQLTFGTGTLMEVADFGKYAVMMNGTGILHYDYTSDSWLQVDPSATIPLLRTICNFKGQAVGGAVTNGWNSLDEKHYVWSKIGSFDFTVDETNEAGYRRCPYGGDVYHIRRLDQLLIGYSSMGVTFLHAMNEPVTTFGFKERCEVGLVNRGAVNGNKGKHIFVGSDYILREVTTEGVKELGYQHILETLEGQDVIVNYDPIKGDFYIGNETKTFLFSNYGMTEVRQHPSTIWRTGRSMYAIPEFVDDSEPYLNTEIFNMGYKGQKTSFVVESDVTGNDDIDVEVSVTNDSKTWTTVGPKPMNDKMISSIIATGDAFKVKLIFNDELSTDTKIGFIKMRYKMTDLRGIRGVYAPGLRGDQK